MADKRKPTLCSMSDIVNFMLESVDEIDLEHSSDESNVESVWKYEKDFQSQKPADYKHLHLLVIPLRAMSSWTAAKLMMYLL